VEETRVGRVFDLEVNATDTTAAKAEIEQMCEKLLANPLIESYEIELVA
jgi:phosphoribosylformylglycinamidine synthase